MPRRPCEEFIVTPAMHCCDLLPLLQDGGGAEGCVVGITTGGPNASGFWTLDPHAGLFCSSVASGGKLPGNRLSFSLGYPHYAKLRWYRSVLA